MLAAGADALARACSSCSRKASISSTAFSTYSSARFSASFGRSAFKLSSSRSAATARAMLLSFSSASWSARCFSRLIASCRSRKLMSSVVARSAIGSRSASGSDKIACILLMGRRSIALPACTHRAACISFCALRSPIPVFFLTHASHCPWGTSPASFASFKQRPTSRIFS